MRTPLLAQRHFVVFLYVTTAFVWGEAQTLLILTVQAELSLYEAAEDHGAVRRRGSHILYIISSHTAVGLPTLAPGGKTNSVALSPQANSAD
jgi:hypothetical protein